MRMRRGHHVGARQTGARRGHHVGARQTPARCAECEMWDRSANVRRGAPAWVCLALVPAVVVGARRGPMHRAWLATVRRGIRGRGLRHRRSWLARARGPMHCAWLATVRRGIRGRGIPTGVRGWHAPRGPMHRASLATVRRGMRGEAFPPAFIVAHARRPMHRAWLATVRRGMPGPYDAGARQRPSRRGQANRGEMCGMRDVGSQRQHTPRHACVGLPRPRAGVRGRRAPVARCTVRGWRPCAGECEGEAFPPPFVVGARLWPDAPCVVGDRSPGNTRARHSHRRSWLARVCGPMHLRVVGDRSPGNAWPLRCRGEARPSRRGQANRGEICAVRDVRLQRQRTPAAPAWVCLALVPAFVVGARLWPDAPCVDDTCSPGR